MHVLQSYVCCLEAGVSGLWQALDAGTAAVLPEGLRSELEQLEESGGVRHLNDLKDQIQVGRISFNSFIPFWYQVTCCWSSCKTITLLFCSAHADHMQQMCTGVLHQHCLEEV